MWKLGERIRKWIGTTTIAGRMLPKTQLLPPNESFEEHENIDENSFMQCVVIAPKYSETRAIKLSYRQRVTSLRSQRNQKALQPHSSQCWMKTSTTLCCALSISKIFSLHISKGICFTTKTNRLLMSVFQWSLKMNLHVKTSLLVELPFQANFNIFLFISNTWTIQKWIASYGSMTKIIYSVHICLERRLKGHWST